MYYDTILALLDNWPTKLSISSISALLNTKLGGGEWLLVMTQYLVFIDLVLGISRAIISREFCPVRFGKGVSKLVSIYTAIILVGIGTHAIDEVTNGIAIFGVAGAHLYDLFLFYLLTNELVSLNKHLAFFHFPINERLEVYLSAFSKKAESRIQELVSGEHKHHHSDNNS